MSDLPRVSALCPSFHRPKLLANALACWMAQDYDGPRELIIVDDGNDFADQEGPNWRLVSVADRFKSLPEKFNYAASLATGDVLMVWEDDDVYLSTAISSHVAALQSDWSFPVGGYSKPSKVLSTYPGHVVTEGAAGRFHASIAFTRQTFDQIGGWPLTKRADFDQQFMSLLAGAVRGETVDPCQFAPPSYCFRYGSTGMYHGQHFMTDGPDGTEWYDRVPHQPGNRDLILHPEFDDETRAIYASHGRQEVSPQGVSARG